MNGVQTGNSAFPAFEQHVTTSTVLDTLAHMQRTEFVLTERGIPLAIADAYTIAEQIFSAEMREYAPRLLDAAIAVVVDDLNVRRQLSAATRESKSQAKNGWIFLAELRLAPTTRRMQFRCARGHLNQSTDRGTCSRCPSCITDVQSTE